MTDWLYTGIFFSSFLAATILPLSSEAVLSAAIAGGVNIEGAIASATLGNWLGGMSSFYLGRLGKWTWINKFFSVEKSKIEQLHFKYAKYGVILAFFAWLPIIGDLIAIALGYFRCNIKYTALLMLAGKLMRYILWALITIKTINLVTYV